LISKFRLVVNVIFFPLGHSQASEFYVPTFRNTLSAPVYRNDLNLKILKYMKLITVNYNAKYFVAFYSKFIENIINCKIFQEFQNYPDLT